jgi:hypothetical protein
MCIVDGDSRGKIVQAAEILWLIGPEFYGKMDIGRLYREV